MHDPLTVAHEIRRPWPQRSPGGLGRPEVRWSFGRHRAAPGSPGAKQAEATRRSPFPWWKPSSYSPFWVLAGRTYWWPPLITIWHVEPGGADSGEVCKHYERWQDEAGQWHTKPKRAWKYHVHHFRIQIAPVQALKRRLWTRCAECGRSFKGESVVSTSWNGNGPRWFKGEAHVFHFRCHELVGLRRRHHEDGEVILQFIDGAVGFTAVDGTAVQAFLEDTFGRSGDSQWLTTFNKRRRIEHLLAARKDRDDPTHKIYGDGPDREKIGLRAFMPAPEGP